MRRSIVVSLNLQFHPGHHVRSKGLKFFWVWVVGLLNVGGPLFAHHGSAGFSLKVLILRRATVIRFRWANPHTLVLFDVKDDNGNIVHWAGETGSTASLRVLGWTKNSLQPGETITVYIYPHKFQKAFGRVDKIILADGETLRDSGRGDRGDVTRY
jgi:hypothetical protein